MRNACALDYLYEGHEANKTICSIGFIPMWQQYFFPQSVKWGPQIQDCVDLWSVARNRRGEHRGGSNRVGEVQVPKWGQWIHGCLFS